MTETNLTDRLDEVKHALNIPAYLKFVLSGIKSFYRDVFFKMEKYSCFGKIPGLLPEKPNQILQKFVKKTIPEFMELSAAEGVCISSLLLGYVSLSVNQVFADRYVGRA